MMYPHEDKQKNHSFLFEVSSFAFGEIRGRVFCFLLVLIPDRDRDRQLRTWTNDTIKRSLKSTFITNKVVKCCTYFNGRRLYRYSIIFKELLWLN